MRLRAVGAKRNNGFSNSQRLLVGILRAPRNTAFTLAASSEVYRGASWRRAAEKLPNRPQVCCPHEGSFQWSVQERCSRGRRGHVFGNLQERLVNHPRHSGLQYQLFSSGALAT